MRGGQRASPPERVGLASVAVGVQRAGGSSLLPAEAFDAALEQMGASIGVYCNFMTKYMGG